MASAPDDAALPTGSEECSLEEITAAAYGELRRLARGYLYNNPGSLTLRPTALVHEAYMRMAKQDKLRWRNRGHFFGIAARCMRQILVEHARVRGAEKRGGDARRADPEILVRIGSGRIFRWQRCTGHLTNGQLREPLRKRPFATSARPTMRDAQALVAECSARMQGR